MFADGEAASFTPTVVSLRQAHPDLPIVVGTPDPGDAGALSALGVEVVPAATASDLVRRVWDERRCHVLAVTDRAVFPGDALGPARRILDADLRVSSVSFLGNAAAFLSFPERNTAVSHQVAGLDEEAVTRALRTTAPEQRPAPIPFAAGPAVLLSSFAISAIGPPGDVGPHRAAVAVADFSLRGRRRGFLDVVDPSTFVARPYDLGPLADPWLTTDERQWLLARHPFFAAVLDEQSASDDSALATVHATSRTKVLGLRVLVDGSCLGPREMGTQVHTVSLIDALARRSDVAQVCVSLASPVPPYAARILSHPKVDARSVVDGDVSGFGPVDVGHRPFQPVETLHPSWFKVAARTVVTVLDLISYQVGIYHASAQDWMAHREIMRRVAGEVDALVAISHDVREHVLLERLPVESERTFVVQLGTDHLLGDEVASVPSELLARGFVAGAFALVLGTNYAHKNRDIAIEVVSELRRRGHELGLVMAGATVPFGSSRVLESQHAAAEHDVYGLPDVTSAERNWLLHHAAVVLYPTSAEGFGLVPYEAARFATPTILVPFGPLGEVAGDLPVLAADWSPASLADAAERVLTDPETARRQVAAALRSGEDFTWDATAAKLVEVYRSLLAAPARGAARPTRSTS